MKVAVGITGHSLESSKYVFKLIDNTKDFTTHVTGSFSISTKLIRIQSLPNTTLNLNGISIGRKIILHIENDAIEELINSSQEMKTIGLNLLRQEIINQFRI